MSDHTTAFVPIETWAYQSPELAQHRQRLDMGLMCEALIYYDRVVVVPATPGEVAKVVEPAEVKRPPSQTNETRTLSPFGLLVEWFVQRGHLADFRTLLSEDSLRIYHYAFQTIPIQKDGMFGLMNVVDRNCTTIGDFWRTVLWSGPWLADLVPRARHREQLYRALEGRVIEVGSSEFGPSVQNARADFADSDRVTNAAQSFVDLVRPTLPHGAVPDVVKVITSRSEENGRVFHKFNFDFGAVGRLAPSLALSPALLLAGLANVNRSIWSASLMSCDLYLPPPMSSLAQMKLRDGNDRRAGVHELVGLLQDRVEFPDVRQLINSGSISFSEVLTLRKAAVKFRRWLQDGVDRDRDALIAYHHEVVKATGWSGSLGKMLSVGGFLGSVATRTVVSAAIGPGPVETVAAEAAGESVRYLMDLATRFDENWKPVVFGQQASELIERERYREVRHITR